MLPEDGALAPPVAPLDRRQKALAFQRHGRRPRALGGMGGARRVQASRHDVRQMRRRVDDSRLLYSVAPAHYERGGDSAFVRPALESAEGGVGSVRPGQVVAHECERPAGARAADIAHADALAAGKRAAVPGGLGRFAVLRQKLRAAAVVGHEHYQGVVVFAVRPERVENPADALVDAVYLGGVNRHAEVFPVAVARVFPSGAVGVSRAYLPLLVENPHALEAFVAGRSQRVPAAAIIPFVPRDVLFQGVERPVGGGERDVHEEGRVLLRRLADHLGGVVGDGVGEIEAVVERV